MPAVRWGLVLLLAGCGRTPTAPVNGPCVVTQTVGTLTITAKLRPCPDDSTLAANGWRKP